MPDWVYFELDRRQNPKAGQPTGHLSDLAGVPPAQGVRVPRTLTVTAVLLAAALTTVAPGQSAAAGPSASAASGGGLISTPIRPAPGGGPIAPAAVNAVTDFVTPPQPAGSVRAVLDSQIHPHRERDIWIEEHLALGDWHNVVNGLPMWRYVFHTRWDQTTDVQLHYGACVSGRPCIRLYDGFLGQTKNLAETRGWVDSAGKITGWIAITFNDSFFAPGSPNYNYDDDESRGPVLCHEGGHALGIFKHRTTNDSCMYNPAPDTGWYNRPSSVDVAQLNGAY
jgi:hypothetical protein